MYSGVRHLRLGGVGFADVWDMWIELCWERFMESSSKEESSSVSSMAIGPVMVFSVDVGGVGWGSCMSMCWGCLGLAVVVVEHWAMEASSVRMGISLFSKVYESVMNLP